MTRSAELLKHLVRAALWCKKCLDVTAHECLEVWPDKWDTRCQNCQHHRFCLDLKGLV